MKKLITLLLGMILTASLYAQAPQKMSYQAVIRDANNALVSSQVVGMQISILQNSATGTPVYVETQAPNTNVNGLVSLEIGNGSVVSGNFASIDWANDTYFVKTETDPMGGNNYSITGVSQLLSVPYALYAGKADSATHVNITGTETAFIGWDKNVADDFNGQYSNLVGAPSNVSAFTNDSGYLTSFTEVDGSITNEIQVLSLSNDTLYLSDGGFAILPAGFDGQYSSLVGAPTNVSAFTNDAGYLTTEVDSSVTNEIQDLAQVLAEGNDAASDSILNLRQLTIGAAVPMADAALDINVNDGALLLPRLTTAQRNSLSPVEGMTIFNKDEHKFQGYREDDVIDQENGNATNCGGFVGPGFGQSFTPTISGDLTAIRFEICYGIINNVATLTMYLGDSISNNPISTQTFNVYSGPYKYNLPTPVTLVAGQIYTIRVDGGFNALWIDSNNYAGGQAFSVNNIPIPAYDFKFETFMDVTGWVDFH